LADLTGVVMFLQWDIRRSGCDEGKQRESGDEGLHVASPGLGTDYRPWALCISGRGIGKRPVSQRPRLGSYHRDYRVDVMTITVLSTFQNDSGVWTTKRKLEWPSQWLTDWKIAPDGAGCQSSDCDDPIVFTTGFDPVRTGLVPSISRPGGNVTGVLFTVTDLAAKQLGVLHELIPKAAIIAVLGDANQPELDLELREIEAAGRAIGRQILVVKVASEREFNAAFATVVQGGAGALLVRGSPRFLNRRRQLVALATRHARCALFGQTRLRILQRNLTITPLFRPSRFPDLIV
jgi:hypothetical protein